MKHFVLYPDSITIVRAEGYRETARSDQSKCRVRGETIAKGDERMAYRVVPLCMTVDLEPDGIGGAERITQRELISFSKGVFEC